MILTLDEPGLPVVYVGMMSYFDFRELYYAVRCDERVFRQWRHILEPVFQHRQFVRRYHMRKIRAVV